MGPAPLWRPGLLKSQHIAGFFDVVVVFFYYRPVVPALGAVVCGPCAALAPGPAEKLTYSWLFGHGGISFLLAAGSASPGSRGVWALRQTGAGGAPGGGIGANPT